MSAATVKKNRESTLKGGRWWKEVGWRHIVAILMIIYCLVPLLYVLSVSLNPGATLTGSNSLFSNGSRTSRRWARASTPPTGRGLLTP